MMKLYRQLPNLACFIAWHAHLMSCPSVGAGGLRLCHAVVVIVHKQVLPLLLLASLEHWRYANSVVFENAFHITLVTHQVV